jgi:hypothetical protein
MFSLLMIASVIIHRLFHLPTSRVFGDALPAHSGALAGGYAPGVKAGTRQSRIHAA